MKAKVKYYPNGDIIPEATHPDLKVTPLKRGIKTDKKSQPQSTKNADKKKEK